MKNDNKSIGNYGEDLIYDYYKNHSYKILDKNYRTSNGEVDLITYKNGIIIFVEIKTRFNNNFGFPCESVGISKQRIIKNISRYYIHNHHLYNYNVRYDVAEVYLNYFDNSYKINILKDAFR